MPLSWAVPILQLPDICNTTSSSLSCPNTPTQTVDRLGFHYIWPVKVTTRQLSPTEAIILQISPKFATVHDHVSFQWTLKMHGKANVVEEEDDEEGQKCETIQIRRKNSTNKTNEERDNSEGEEDEEEEEDSSYVAISLYYVDGPVSNVELRAKVGIITNKRSVSISSYDKNNFKKNSDEGQTVVASRGGECELAFLDREHLSSYIKAHVGQVIRLSLFMEMNSSLYKTDAYLNAVSPTPIHSFLTANYRARASSKVWKRRSRQSIKRPRSASDSQSHCKKLDLERAFNRVMEEERERRQMHDEMAITDESNPNNNNNNIDNKNLKIRVDASLDGGCCSSNENNINMGAAPYTYDQHLFKKLLIACCDTCERRASLIVSNLDGTSDDDNLNENDETSSNFDEVLSSSITSTTTKLQQHQQQQRRNSVTNISDESDDEDNVFECPEENKAEMHDTLANMYFNKVVLPEMEYVEDFADFLIDAELNDLPVLKRACERYLCGELNTKRDLMTSLLLDLFFLSMIFQLPVMKSMTLTELCERHNELEDPKKLLNQEEYANLDKRIRKMCDRNLSDLIDEVKRFREQKLRVQPVKLGF